jgi:predicted ATPase
MIRQVKIENFKSHKHTELELSNLTILCGANSSGKSSVIQAMLLLRESFHKYKFDYLDLKTDSVNIGTAKEALYQFSEKDKFTFQINDLKFNFIAKDLTKTLIKKSSHKIDFQLVKKESLFSKNKNCQFISAFRLGPQVSYPKNDKLNINNQISDKEGKAENVIQFLYKEMRYKVISEICIPEQDTDLFAQVTAWERKISSGVNVIVKDNGNLDYELKYQFNTDKGRTDEFNAFNVGFGLTYALPVIVAILSASKGAILFIENPEAHLHPKGQAKLAELIALAAQAGIQIVIETHSDHIINGILVQCKKFELKNKGIDRNNVKLYYFGEMDALYFSKYEKIEIQKGGKIDKQPEGFFDQIQNDLKIIMGF